MAKKIADIDNQTTRTQDLPPDKNESPTPALNDSTSGNAVSTSKPEKKPSDGQSDPAIPEYAERILQVFPNYAELYIDFQGGTFTVDTPPAFRSNATRYTNPYHKS